MAEKQPGTYQRLPQVIDLNLLPPEYRPKPLSDWTVLFFLLSLGAASLLYPLNMGKMDRGEQLVRMKTELAVKQQAVKQVAALETKVKELSASLTQTKKKADSVQGDYQVLSGRTIAWSGVVGAIDSEANNYKIVLQSLVQDGSRMTVKGTAPDYSSGITFASSLLGSGLFSAVSFQNFTLETIPLPVPATIPPGTKAPPPPPPRLVHSFTLLLEAKAGGGR